jgi:amidase
LSGVKAFMRAIIDAKPWLKDPLAVRKSWDEEAYQLTEHGGGKALCFAIMWNDGLVVPHPPVIRALEKVKVALTQQGHQGTKFPVFCGCFSTSYSYRLGADSARCIVP